MRYSLKEKLHLGQPRRDNSELAAKTATRLRKESTCFMDLPSELRVEIYRYLFTTSQLRQCEQSVNSICAGENCFGYKRASSPPGYPGPHRSLHENAGPVTCFPVSTDILRVSKQIYREALPIMWQTVEFAVIMHNFKIFRKSAPEFIKRSFKFEDEDMALNVRSMVLAIPFRCPRMSVVRADPYPQILTQLELYCGLIKDQRPKLRELRVYVDRWSIIPPRERYFGEVVEALEIFLKRLDGIVLYVDIHTCRLNGSESDPLLQQDVVKSLRESAKRMEKDISVESWARVSPVKRGPARMLVDQNNLRCVQSVDGRSYVVTRVEN